MKGKATKIVDKRVSVTIHLRPQEARSVDVAAARAGTTRHDFVRGVMLNHAVADEAPVLACLARLLAIHDRLKRDRLLDDELRSDLVGAIRELTAAARVEVAG